APEVDATGAPTLRPLARAPIASLTQQSPNGLLPIVASNGMTSAQAYARPFQPQSNRPLLAVVIGGLGFNAAATTQAINELPPEITLSFVPYASNLQSWIDQARAHGHEVMLELPMEPFDSNADDTGPQTLLSSATPQQNVAHLEQLLGRGAGYFGVTNYQGARFATSAQASQPVVQALKRRGLAFISSGIGQRTALSVEASRAGLTNTAADRIIDARREADSIDDQLLNLEALALQNQNAIGAGFAYPVTMQQVGHWAADVGSRGYQLAPVSAVLAARAGRR
ncbi:MAG: divergent polysaccharide deacetylase family protein, partial [Proteobacteria bacterium]|nr:divergent polysaccharide deacetylase family protein [Pseudomonadota bacterium]